MILLIKSIAIPLLIAGLLILLARFPFRETAPEPELDEHEKRIAE
jgi:hypothetical protein